MLWTKSSTMTKMPSITAFTHIMTVLLWGGFLILEMMPGQQLCSLFNSQAATVMF